MSAASNNTDFIQSLYEGENKNRIAHGKGIMKYPNGDIYDGTWRNGERHGSGIFTYANGDVYDGIWRNGERHGSGILIQANGEIYGGVWKDGKKHGKGIKIFQKTIIITMNDADADEEEENVYISGININTYPNPNPIISIKKSIDLKIGDEIQQTLQEIKTRKNRWFFWPKLFSCSSRSS